MKMSKMSTELWVLIGIVLIVGGTFIMWYVPYKESRDKELETKETCRFSKRIPFNVKYPLLFIGDSSSGFEIRGDDNIPFLTDGKGKGKLYIPSKTGTGQGILYAWIQDQEVKLSLTIFNEKHEVISSVSGNEWVVNKSKEVDCNFDLENFEVVRIKNNSFIPILQIELREDSIKMAFETYLQDGTNFLLGNNKMAFASAEKGSVINDLKPLFKYPSKKNFGKRN